MRLLLYIVRRLLLLIPTLIGVTLITFVLSRAVPVDQLVSIYINPRSPVPRDQQIAVAIRLLHLDEPIPVQYVYYLGSLLRGDWGFTNTELFHGSATDALVLFFPPTVELAIAATVLATLIGIPLGTVSAVRKDRLSDHVTRVVALTGYSVPLFWLALLLQIFAVKYLPSLPIQGQVSQGMLSGRAWVVGSGVFDSQPTHFFILDAALVIAITFLGTIVAAAILPWRRKDIYANSPIARYNLAGIPALTIAAVITGAFLLFTLYQWFSNSLYGVNNRTSLYFMGAMYILAIVIYAVAFYVRRRQGIDLNRIHEAIPVE